jgi:FtsH-binding integral membrane protein
MSQSNRDQYFAEADAREYAGVATNARVAFIRKTYGHLLGAVLLWVALVAAILNVPALTNMVIGMWNISPWMIFGLYFVGSMVAQAMANSRSSQGVQYLGLGLYTLVEAIVFAPLLLFLSMWQGGTEIISQAGILTLIIFGGLTAVVMLTKKDFSFMRNVLWLCSLAAFGLIIASMFGGISLGLWFVVGMIVLMSGFILYDTSNVLHHYHESQYVAASLKLFASLATLFWYVLHLTAAFSND